MAIEIERKLLVAGDAWRGAVIRAGAIRQGYLATAQGFSVRVRTRGEEAWLTVKAGIDMLSRAEFEYPIPLADAEQLLALCPRAPLEKTRHIVPAGDGLLWEVDEFGGTLAGLIVAEIELPQTDTAFARPAWLGAEVTADPRYLNSNLHRFDLATLPA